MDDESLPTHLVPGQITYINTEAYMTQARELLSQASKDVIHGRGTRALVKLINAVNLLLQLEELRDQK